MLKTQNFEQIFTNSSNSRTIMEFQGHCHLITSIQGRRRETRNILLWNFPYILHFKKEHDNSSFSTENFQVSKTRILCKLRKLILENNLRIFSSQEYHSHYPELPEDMAHFDKSHGKNTNFQDKNVFSGNHSKTFKRFESFFT